MNMDVNRKNKLVNWTCIALMAIMIVLQFMPFWCYGDQETQTASINGYIWFPNDHKELNHYLKTIAGSDFEVDQILLMPIFNLLAGFFGILLCLTKPHTPIIKILPAACGLVGLWGYLTEPVFRLGTNWGIHLLVCAALLIVAGGFLFCYIRDIKNGRA